MIIRRLPSSLRVATSAGLRRINFVRAGGVCQYIQVQDHCEHVGGCRPCCSPIDGWTEIDQPVSVPCQPHTWVYNVPSS